LVWKVGSETLVQWVNDGYVPKDTAKEIFEELISKEKNKLFLEYVCSHC
jgi:hypothetical protein